MKVYFIHDLFNFSDKYQNQFQFIMTSSSFEQFLSKEDERLKLQIHDFWNFGRSNV